MREVFVILPILVSIYKMHLSAHLYPKNAMQKVKVIVRYHIEKRSRASRSPPVTLVVHGSSDLPEASDIGTTDEGWELALSRGDVLLCGVEAVLEALLHDALELLVDLLSGP
jgi:hypothetical protein